MATRTATAIRFASELHNRLIEYADATALPVNTLVNMAVRDFLNSLPPAEECVVVLTRDKDGQDG